MAGIYDKMDPEAAAQSIQQMAEKGKIDTAVTILANMRDRQAANLLRGRTIGCLPIVEDGKAVGIVTTTDLLELIGRGSERPVQRVDRWILRGRGPRRAGASNRRSRSA